MLTNVRVPWSKTAQLYCLAGGIGALIGALAGEREVFAGHPFGADSSGFNAEGGDCAGFYGQVNCRTNYNWQQPNTLLIRNISQLGSFHDDFEDALGEAEIGWRQGNPPLVSFSQTPRSNDSFNYLKVSAVDFAPFDLDATRNQSALVRRCNENHFPVCSDPGEIEPVDAFDVQWSELYVNVTWNPQNAPLLGQRFLFEHEFGHTIGLAHHTLGQDTSP